MKRTLPVVQGMVLVLSVLALSAGTATAGNYEVWNCGDFNIQGYDDMNHRQYYPFSAKIGDLYVLADFGTGLVLLNPDYNGNRFAYVVYRLSGAPVWWLSFGENWNVENSAEIISSCSWSIPSGCEGKCCGDYGVPCVPGTDCLCFTTTEGYGVCTNDRPCPLQSECDSSADCVRGQRCITCTCCGENLGICVQPTCGPIDVRLEGGGPTMSGK